MLCPEPFGAKAVAVYSHSSPMPPNAAFDVVRRLIIFINGFRCWSALQRVVEVRRPIPGAGTGSGPVDILPPG
jgi:hypothetical protein